MTTKSAKYERTQGTEVLVGKVIANAIGDTSDADFLSLSCTINKVSVKRGQKQDITVTTLASTAEETINGLPSQGEITLDGNWVGDDEAQSVLEHMYKTNEIHEFRVIFPSGSGFACLGEVRDIPIDAGINAIATSTFTIRVAKGDVERLENKSQPNQPQNDNTRMAIYDEANV